MQPHRRRGVSDEFLWLSECEKLYGTNLLSGYLQLGIGTSSECEGNGSRIGSPGSMNEPGHAGIGDSAGERFYEIDFARGIAIVMMIIFHTLFDIAFLGIYPVSVYSGFWHIFAYVTATLFVLLVGISLTLSAARAVPQLQGFAYAWKFIRRGLWIFALGMVITFATWIYLGEGYVIFGILQLIGISVILGPVFFRFKMKNIIFGSVAILAGLMLQGVEGPIWLVWLGIHPQSFYSVDYTPLLPWFGVVLIGIAVGQWLYPGGLRRFSLPELKFPPIRGISFLGRHSLFIYFIHQPIILIALSFLR